MRDLAAAVNGSLAVSCSSIAFRTVDNLLLLGRSSDMSNGWETERSREGGNSDWVIIRLGASGYLSRIVIDTAYFKGNFLQQVKVEWAFETDGCEEKGLEWNKTNSDTILEAENCFGDEVNDFGPNVLALTTLAGGLKLYTHVNISIIPNGAVKRMRIFGQRPIRT
jgi:allantoicase